ncbi:HNH endonuclease family protein, partial [Serratia sp. CY68801]
YTGKDALQEIYSTLVHIVKRLKFITIEVETDYDAFLLFESLNSKGMDLSVADLLKNKILMKANGDEHTSELLLNNWEEMISSVESSRLSPVDFLRVYWEAIQGANITKKELYKNIGVFIDKSNDILSFSRQLKDIAYDFSIYASGDLIFPTSIHQTGKDKYLAFCGEINSLKYTTCLPLLMYTHQHKPEMLGSLAKMSLSFLFRWITIGDYSVGGAKKILDEVIKRLQADQDTASILEPFLSQGEKIGDEAFINSMRQFKAHDNQIAKYILSKYYLFMNKEQSIPNYGEVHLEHVIPQVCSLWEKDEKFSLPKGAYIKDYIYKIGNFTLLHKQINQSIKNKTFDKKAKEYSDSIFPETKDIFSQFENGLYWNAEIIDRRGQEIAMRSPDIWPLSI